MPRASHGLYQTLRKLYAPVWKPWTPVEAMDRKMGAVSETARNGALLVFPHNPLVPGSSPSGGILWITAPENLAGPPQATQTILRSYASLPGQSVKRSLILCFPSFGSSVECLQEALSERSPTRPPRRVRDPDVR